MYQKSGGKSGQKKVLEKISQEMRCVGIQLNFANQRVLAQLARNELLSQRVTSSIPTTNVKHHIGDQSVNTSVSA